MEFSRPRPWLWLLGILEASWRGLWLWKLSPCPWTCKLFLTLSGKFLMRNRDNFWRSPAMIKQPLTYLVYILTVFRVNSIIPRVNSDTATVLYLSTMKSLAFETKSLAGVALTTTLINVKSVILFCILHCGIFSIYTFTKWSKLNLASYTSSFHTISKVSERRWKTLYTADIYNK